ncbi:hypothetical protein A9Q84_14680 [Halobacteriovorax marinus]|uniref:Uncharacterized protein n=1 Tax=Halobacteriovorax marinus TaxID=97084 RepID=A0A1Y5FAS8_9BACT|nr:hypothetical protein A9Q84_14680 [Halobacteriovorax marinus]
MKINEIEEIKINEEFKDLALSHYGYDGGNLKSDIWFSGLEWGGGIDLEELILDIKKGALVIPNSVDTLEERKRFLKYPFDRKILKILSYILDHGVSNYRKMINEDISAYSSQGPIMKFNLYPISFKNTSPEFWSEAFYHLTGFPTKELYMAWVQINRFKFFNKLVTDNNPKIIVCAGTSYKKDFLMAFGGIDSLFMKPEKTMILEGKSNVEVYKSSLSSNCRLIITPFFGNRYGINKDVECEKIGDLIKNYL